jgi:signal transduction histidine kinase
MLLSNSITFIALLISEIICIISGITVMHNIKPSQIKTSFLSLIFAMFICCTGLLLQDLLSIPLNIKPIYFDYFVYIGNCLLPISFFITALIFKNTKIKISRKYIALFIIPIFSLLALWTNDFHHLFYKSYSINLVDNVYGPLFLIFDIYILTLFAISIVLFLKQSISTSGLFSSQGLLFIIGSLFPIIQNILSTSKIINSTIYITPICFTFTVLCFLLAVFKFKFLNTTPIALKTIVDRISDSFVIINENLMITDANKAFLDTFKLDYMNIIDTSILTCKQLGINLNVLSYYLEELKSKKNSISFQASSTISSQIFTIELSNIYSNDTLLGILILFKDITQHIKDLETIQNNQDRLIEQERLASLGQMIGGIAHNLKTPIMSIAGAVEGLKDLVKEYASSISDPDVTIEDHHEIANDMYTWLEKIKTHIGYMSDVITAVKGQAVTFSDDRFTNYNCDELVKMVGILMKHELSTYQITLNISNNVPNTLQMKGNINSLVQVVNNIISNAIQASQNAPKREIDLSLNVYNNKNVIISIQDYGTGMSDKVKNTLFKQMITTKGKNGTGLGLFMSYSNIKAHFNGNITFKSEEGKGTTFDIILPI